MDLEAFGWKPLIILQAGSKQLPASELCSHSDFPTCSIPLGAFS